MRKIESIKENEVVHCPTEEQSIRSFPDNVEIWGWWQTQKFQKEQGGQEYTMIYEIDLPKILKAFVDSFPNCV